jgi:hypothetical protein
MQARRADEVEVLRRGIDWLERLERHEMVGMNLDPDTEDATESVGIDDTRVRRVLAHMAADVDTWAYHDTATEAEKPADRADSRTRYRRRVTEPEELLRSRTAKEPRDAKRSVSHTLMRFIPSTSALFVGRKPAQRVRRSWANGGRKRSRQRGSRRTQSLGETQMLAWTSKPSSCAWRGPRAVTWARSSLPPGRRKRAVARPHGRLPRQS